MEATLLQFSALDFVRIWRNQTAGTADYEELVGEGEVASVDGETLCLTLQETAIPEALQNGQTPQLLLRKAAAHGMVEVEVRGELCHSADDHPRRDGDGHLLIQATLIGPPHKVQRRAACRFPLDTPARYRLEDGKIWHQAHLYDISVSGIALLVPDEELMIGLRLDVEFDVEEQHFVVPAIVCRLDEHRPTSMALYGLEFSGLEMRERNRLAREIAHLEMRLIANRVRLE